MRSSGDGKLFDSSAQMIKVSVKLPCVSQNPYWLMFLAYWFATREKNSKVRDLQAHPSGSFGEYI